jgi:hypothetical protein
MWFQASLTEGRDFFIIEVLSSGCSMEDEIRYEISSRFRQYPVMPRVESLRRALAANIVAVPAGARSMKSEPGPEGGISDSSSKRQPEKQQGGS